MSIVAYTAPVQIEEPGVAVVDAPNLLSIIRACPDENVTLDTIKAEKDQVLHVRGRDSHFKLFVMPAEDFPPMPKHKGEPVATIKSESLAALIDRTNFACAKESTRYAMAGPWFEVRGSQTLRM